MTAKGKIYKELDGRTFNLRKRWAAPGVRTKQGVVVDGVIRYYHVMKVYL